MKKAIYLTLFIVIIGVLAFEAVMASKYEMQVNVSEEPNMIGVNPSPESLDFGDLSKNIMAEKSISLRNDSDLSFYALVWATGELSELVRMENRGLVLKPGEEAELFFKLKIPPSAESRTYSGKVTVFYIPKLF